MLRKRLKIIALTVGTAALLTTSAEAATITSSAGVRPCVDTANRYCNAIGTFAAKSSVAMQCWIDGSWATEAYRSNRWFLVRRSDGYEGFVHSSRVGSQTSTSNCGTSLRVKAGLEAIKRMGQATASSSDAGLFTDWAPGPYGEWSGDCKKLVSTAYRRAGLTLRSGNAKPTFDYYWANRSARGGGLPRYGALVGFNIALPYGHIAVAVGGNRIATTRGNDGQRLTNEIQSTSTYSNYVGWVLP